MRVGVAGSKPDIVKPGVAGSSTKSPASSVISGWPSTASRQLPSSTVQKLGSPYSEYRTAQLPAALMRFEKTVRGRSSAMTSESGSGLSLMKYGLYTVERPASGD
jgi:hypothetical protein